MSNLPGNPYMERMVADAMERTPESLATLAVAFETRTLTLVTLLGIMDREVASGKISADGLAKAQDIRDHVYARLGLVQA